MVRDNPLNRTAKFMLTLSGAWPSASCALFMRTFFVVSVIITQYCHYRYFTVHMHSATLLEYMDILLVSIAHSKMLFKCVVLWLNQRKFVEVLTIMREDWSDCINNDINMRETASKAKTSERITNLILILHTMTVSGYGLGVILADIDVTDNTTELRFFTKIEVPFDINTQRTYRCILVVEFVFLLMWSWSSGAINSLLIILTFHTAGQIDIVRYLLMHFALSKDENKDETIVIIKTKIIEKHKKIIRLSEYIESIFTYIALVLFVSNSVMICFLAFLVVTAIGNSNLTERLTKSILFFIITNLEAYMFCYAGEYLKNKSKEIGFAVYSCTWYDMESKDSRVLLFVILRSQKPLTLTAGKMMELSLQSFTSIMNASGTYLSVLLAMQ